MMCIDLFNHGFADAQKVDSIGYFKKYLCGAEVRALSAPEHAQPEVHIQIIMDTVNDKAKLSYIVWDSKSISARLARNVQLRRPSCVPSMLAPNRLKS